MPKSKVMNKNFSPIPENVLKIKQKMKFHKSNSVTVSILSARFFVSSLSAEQNGRYAFEKLQWNFIIDYTTVENSAVFKKQKAKNLIVDPILIT